MADETRIARFFAEVQEHMKLKFRGWETDIPHEGEKGGIRERRVADFLLSIIPSRFGLGAGHIIDSQKNAVVSHQMDIVIYDKEDGLALPVDDYYSLFPCECVYAVIEVKSTLDASDGEKGPSGSIWDCIEKATRINELDRSKHHLSPIHFLVFSYETSWNENASDHVKEWFEKLGSKYLKRLPEVVFVLDPCFVLGTSGMNGYNDSRRFTNRYRESPLLYFASDLIHRLSTTSVYTPNLWQDYIKWGRDKVIAEIYKE